MENWAAWSNAQAQLTGGTADYAAAQAAGMDPWQAYGNGSVDAMQAAAQYNGAEYGEYTEQDAANWQAYQQQVAAAQQQFLAQQQQWTSQQYQEYQRQLAAHQQQQIMAQWGAQVFPPDVAAQYGTGPVPAAPVEAGAAVLQQPPPPPPPEDPAPAAPVGPPPPVPPPTAAVEPPAPVAAAPSAAAASTAAQTHESNKNADIPNNISAKEQEEIRQLQRADELFDKQFAAWEDQFTKWKDENRGTSYTQQLRSYEEEMLKMKNKLLSRRDQLRHRLAVKLAKARGEETPPEPPPPPPPPPPAPMAGDDPSYQDGAENGSLGGGSAPSQDDWNNRPTPSGRSDQEGSLGYQRGGAMRGRGRGRGGADWGDRFEPDNDTEQWVEGGDYPPSGPAQRPLGRGGRGGFGRGGSDGFNQYSEPGWDGPPWRGASGPRGRGRFDGPSGRGGRGGRPPWEEPAPGHGIGRGGPIPGWDDEPPYGDDHSFDEYADSGTGYDESPGRRGFAGRGGFNEGPGRGGFNKGPGRGGFNEGPGRGDFNEGPSRGDFNKGPGRGGFNEGPGRGGLNEGPGRGGLNEGPGRGGRNEGPGRGDFNEGPGRGGFNEGPERGGFNEGPGRGGFNHSSGRGGFNEGLGRGGFSDGSGRGGFSDGPGRGGFNEGPSRGGFNEGPGRSGFDEFRGKKGFNDGPSRGGFNEGPGRGGFEGPGRSGFNEGPGRGGFNEGPGRGRFNEGPGRGGFSGGPGRGGFNEGFGRGAFNDGPGRGRFNEGRGRSGGFNEGPGGRGGFDEGPGYGPTDGPFEDDWSGKGVGMSRGRGRGGPSSGDRYGPAVQRSAGLDADEDTPADQTSAEKSDEPYDPMKMAFGDRASRSMSRASGHSQDSHAVIDYGHQNAMDVVSKYDTPSGGQAPPPELRDAIESVFAAFKRPASSARESSVASSAGGSGAAAAGGNGGGAPPSDTLSSALGALKNAGLLTGRNAELLARQNRPTAPAPPSSSRFYNERDPDGYGLGPSHPDDYADYGGSRPLRRRSRSPGYYRRRSPSPRGWRGSPGGRRRSRSRSRSPSERRRDRDRERSVDRDRDRERERSPPRRRDRYGDGSPRSYSSRSSPSRRRWSPARDRDEGRGRPPPNYFEHDRRYPGSPDRPGDRGPHTERRGEPPRRPEPDDRRQPRGDEAAAPSPPRLVGPPCVDIMELLKPPGRLSRPAKIVIIMRGLPGSGKTYTAKLIKDQELSSKGSAPRILSLDDYFCTEKEKNVKDPVTGKMVNKKEMEYEYDAVLEDAYRTSLNKVFRKTVDDGFFHFVILDCVNAQNSHYESMCNYAASRGFKVYVLEMEADAVACQKRNIHGRTLADVQALQRSWQPTPQHLLRLDVRALLQADSIQEVEMEDTQATSPADEPEPPGEEHVAVSKWEKMDPSEERLAKLDGVSAARRRKEHHPPTMEDYLQLPDDYDTRAGADSASGKKRVRWADVEEQKQQRKMRDLGFVVGQTDWHRMTDPTLGQSALTRTKYI